MSNKITSQTQGTGAVVLNFRNATGSAIAAGVLVKFDTGNKPSSTLLGGIAPTTANTDKEVAGVTLEAIADGATGRVAVAGMVVQVTAKSAITYGDPLMPGSTSGTVSTRTTGKPMVGWAQDDIADGATGPMFIAISDPS